MASIDPGVLRITATVSGARRIYQTGSGLQISHIEMFFNNAASAMPVAGELDIPRPLWRRMGFLHLISIPEIVMVKNSPRDMIPGIAVYDPQAGKLRFRDVAGAAIPAATFGNGGSVRCLVFGL